MSLNLMLGVIIIGILFAIFAYKVCNPSQEAKKNMEKYEKQLEGYSRNVFVAEDQAKKIIEKDKRLR